MKRPRSWAVIERHVVLLVVLVLCVQREGIAFAKARDMNPRPAAPPVALDVPAQEGLSVGDWLVAGSGCPMTRMAAPGHTTVTMIHPDVDKNHYRFIIKLEQLELDGNAPVAPGNPTFARECAIRLAAYPAPGKRIADLRATVGFNLTRSAGAGARVYADLALAAGTIGDWSTEYIHGDKTLHVDADVSLTPTATGKAALAQVRCESPQLAGVDLMLRTDRKTFADNVDIKLVDGTAVLDIDLADCTTP
jgi:hypothetical protein